MPKKNNINKINNIYLNRKTLNKLVKDLNNNNKISGINHNLYKYPACFSPLIIDNILRIFTKKNSLILDPFCGGGTTGLASLFSNRRVILNDLNEFAVFVSKIKITKYTLTSINEFEKWFADIYPKKIQFKNKPFKNFDKNFNRKENWHLRNFIFDYYNKLKYLKNKKSKELATILLLRVVKRAIDTRSRSPKITHVKNITIKYYRELLSNIKEFNHLYNKQGFKKVQITNYDVRDLKNKHFFKKLKKIDAVITSPPYPGVHIRYDRMQLNGTKVTDIHYLLSQTKMQTGISSYTFSNRLSVLDTRYFNMIRESFESLYQIVSRETLIIQLVGFKKKDMLQKYLLTMELAGFKEVSLVVNRKKIDRLWRKVSNRTFHATLKGEIDSASEVLLIHRKEI